MAEQKKTLEPPRVDGFKIFANLEGTFKDVESKLRTVSSLETVVEKDCLSAAYIESRDIEKNPYIFAIFKFKKDSVEVMYTIPPTEAPKKRKSSMVRYFLNLITVVGNNYSIDPRLVYQLLDATLKEMQESISMDYNKLYASYDNIKKDYETSSRRLKKMAEGMDLLKKENYELRTNGDELTLRVKQLESMSEETLKEKLQAWISEHNGDMNVTEFSKFYRVPETRVEEVLNALVNEGLIQSLE